MVTPRVLDLHADGLRLELVTAGAAARRLVVDDGDGPVDVLLGLADAAAYVADGGYVGAVVGRFGNRIDAGQLVVDGVEHRLTTNQFGNTLHGGVDGFDRRDWEVLDEGPSHAILGLTSPDGDQGFPGTLTLTVTYRLAPGRVTIGYTAETDAPTVLNPTHHAYFRLDDGATVDEHTLEVPASSFLALRPDLVPTGEVRAVAGTPFDLRRPSPLHDVLARDDEQLRIAGGIDHHYVVDGTGMRMAARLVAPSGRWLEVHSDQPGVQVYTGAHFDGTQTGLDGRPLTARAGIALETQGYPDAPHHPDWPSTVLRPGERYSSTTQWHLGRD